jgi:hypothetical protein
LRRVAASAEVSGDRGAVGVEDQRAERGDRVVSGIVVPGGHLLAPAFEQRAEPLAAGERRLELVDVLIVLPGQPVEPVGVAPGAPPSIVAAAAAATTRSGGAPRRRARARRRRSGRRRRSSEPLGDRSEVGGAVGDAADGVAPGAAVAGRDTTDENEVHCIRDF